MFKKNNSLNKYQNVDRGMVNWLKNTCLRQVLKIYNSRDRRIWLFGCWEGQKYSDNSKYLYEYVLKNHKDIRCYWVTKNLDVYSYLKLNNKPCVLCGTEEWRDLQLKAGVCFYTNGIDDLGDISYAFGAKFVCLMHGVSFKKIILERDTDVSIWIKLLKIIKRSCYFHMYADYFFTTSEYMKQRTYKQFFGAKLDKIFVTGQPRNDVLAEKRDGLSDFTKIVYMPTYRNNLESANKLNDILKEISENANLIRLLKKFNVKFFIKLHYLTPKINLKDDTNIYVLADHECKDVQKMFLDTDVLITDYSSVANDFSLLNRPIILFPFDKEIYLNEEGFVDEFNDILTTNTTAYTVNELCEILEKVILDKSVADDMLKKINHYFNDDRLKVGEFSKNVYDVIIRQIKNER